MSKDEIDPADQAVLNKWQRSLERSQQVAEHALHSVKKNIAEFLKNPNTRANIATDMKQATKNPSKYTVEGGFNTYDDGEVITGFEPLPWDK